MAERADLIERAHQALATVEKVAEVTRGKHAEQLLYAGVLALVSIAEDVHAIREQGDPKTMLVEHVGTDAEDIKRRLDGIGGE